MNIYFLPNIPLSPLTAIRILQVASRHQKIPIIFCSSDNGHDKSPNRCYKTIHDTFSWFKIIFLTNPFGWDRRDVCNNEIIGRRQYWLRCLRLWLRNLEPVETRPWTDTGPWAARSQAVYTCTQDQRTPGPPLPGWSIWPIKWSKWIRNILYHLLWIV